MHTDTQQKTIEEMTRAEFEKNKLSAQVRELTLEVDLRKEDC